MVEKTLMSGKDRNSRPRILAILPAFIPSTVLAVVKPMTGLHRAERIVADITLESVVSRRQIERADAVIFCRNTQAAYQYVLEAVRAAGKPIIYDIDDNFFELPEYYQTTLAHRTPGQLLQLERYLAAASLVRVYSHPLRERVCQMTSRVALVEAGVDLSLLPQAVPIRDAQKVRIVYATSRWNKDDLAYLFLDDIRQLLTTYPGRVEFFCWGYHPPELRGRPDVHFWDLIPDYDTFFYQFARAGFDVGLAPLRNDLFHRCKTNNKFREYAACRIAGVYSDVDVYAQCIKDGETGLLVSNSPGAWFEALSRLVETPALRREMQDRAFKYVCERHSLEQVQDAWFEQIQEVIASQPECLLQGQRGTEHNQTMGDTRVPVHSFKAVRQMIKRGARLVWGVKRVGIRPTLAKIRHFCGDSYQLLRVRGKLSPFWSRWL